MTKAIKCGYLLRYKRRLFNRYWKEEFIVLYEDSSVAWFKDKNRTEPEGGLLLKEAPELMAMGEYTLRIPHPRPTSLPQGCTVRQVMAFGTPNRQKVHWFVAKSEDEINDWMTAISNTLPIPPGLSVYGDETTSQHIYETIDLQQHAKIAVSEKNPAVLTMTGSEPPPPPLPPTHPHVGSNQPCCLCAATGHGCGGAVGSVVPPANNVVVNPPTAKNPSLGDIATGMMLATGFAHWGWGYGLGWNRPDKPFIGYLGNGYDEPYHHRDNHYQEGRSNHQHDYPDYDDCHDNDFDMDFGGDFGF